MPLVSVILPSYNHERFIAEAIESVLGQTVEDFELIIVDDGSSDNSKEIIESYRVKDARIRTFFNGKNQGISRTMNRGLKEAAGEFMAFISSDDIWLEGKLERQLEILRQNPDIVLYADLTKIDSEGKPLDDDKNINRRSKCRTRNILQDLLKGNFIPGQTMMFRRRNIEGIRYDERLRYLNDWKFVLELAKRWEFCYMPQPLAKYRVHGSNSISQDRAGWLSDFAIFGEYILDEHSDEISNQIEAKHLLRIGCNDCYLGNPKKGRESILKAIITYPFRSEHWRLFVLSFFTNSVVPASLRRRTRS